MSGSSAVPRARFKTNPEKPLAGSFAADLGARVAQRIQRRLGKLAKGSKGYRRSEAVGYPFGVFNIELTNDCPMHCVMCPRTNNMTRAVGFMEFDVFTKVIDELVAANPEYARTNEVWLHHFGESLVHPEFARFTRYAVGRGVKACLSVNPFMLKGKTALKLIEAEPAVLIVSLDGHDDESFERIRGVKNAYEKSKRNLLGFLELKRKHGCGTMISLHMIDFPLNRESMERQKGFWESIEGIDEFVRKGFTTWDGSAQDVNALVGKKVTDDPAPRKKKNVSCTFPWNSLTVAWDGAVLPCCHDYDKKLVLGDVGERTLAEIWNGERMRNLRREFLGNNVTNPLCRNCDMLYGGSA